MKIAEFIGALTHVVFLWFFGGIGFMRIVAEDNYFSWQFGFVCIAGILYASVEWHDRRKKNNGNHEKIDIDKE